MVPMSASDGGTDMPTWFDVLAFAQHAEELAFDSVGSATISSPIRGTGRSRGFTKRGRFSRRSPLRRQGSSWASW